MKMKEERFPSSPKADTFYQIGTIKLLIYPTSGMLDSNSFRIKMMSNKATLKAEPSFFVLRHKVLNFQESPRGQNNKLLSGH
jgi:hypothetical protein